jgi:hypothetical protein
LRVVRYIPSTLRTYQVATKYVYDCDNFTDFLIQQGSRRRSPPYCCSWNPTGSLPSHLDLERNFHRLQVQELPNHRYGLLADPYHHRRYSDVENRQKVTRRRRPVRLLPRRMLRGVPCIGTPNADNQHRRIHQAHHGFWASVPRLLCWKYWSVNIPNRLREVLLTLMQYVPLPPPLPTRRQGDLSVLHDR